MGAGGQERRSRFAMPEIVGAGRLPGIWCVPSFTFDTRDLPAESQFEAWRKSFSPILTLTKPDDSSIGFRGKQVIWDLGCLAFSQIETDAMTFASEGGRARRAPPDHWTMTSLLYGRMGTVTPHKSFEGQAGEVQIHSLCRPFEGWSTKSQMLTLYIPRDFSAEVTQVLAASEFSTINTGMGRLFSDYLLALAKRLSMVNAAGVPGLAAATRAMILACAMPSGEQLRDAKGQTGTIMLERARCCVQRFGGVLRYIQRRRLLEAHSALTDPNDHRRVTEVAKQSGFGNGSEFSRAFKHEFGYTPTELKTGIWTGPRCRPTLALTDAVPEERFGLLLRKLHG
jgi:AraC-like DNA-binding protein